MLAAPQFQGMLEDGETLLIADTTAKLVNAREVWADTSRKSFSGRKRYTRKRNWVKTKIGDRVKTFNGFTDRRLIQKGMILAETVLPQVARVTPMANIDSLWLNHQPSEKYSDKYTVSVRLKAGGTVKMTVLEREMTPERWSTLERLQKELDAKEDAAPDEAELERRAEAMADAVDDAEDALAWVGIWRMIGKIAGPMVVLSMLGLMVSFIGGFMLVSLAAQGGGAGLLVVGLLVIALAFALFIGSIAAAGLASVLRGRAIRSATEILNEATEIQAEPL